MDDIMCRAARLAFLEGVYRLDFPDTHTFTLSSVERRVSAIERAVGGITAPPPHEACSWNGIVWRLWRADLKTELVTNPLFDHYLAGLAGMLEEKYTTDGLRRVVDRLGHDLPEIKCPREQDAAAAAATEGEECKDCLVAVVQKLAYVGGRLRQRPPMEPLSKGTIYAFAAVCLVRTLDCTARLRDISRTPQSGRRRRMPRERRRPEVDAQLGLGTGPRDGPARERGSRACTTPHQPRPMKEDVEELRFIRATLDHERHSVKTWIMERLSIKTIPEGPHSIRTGIVKTL
ncbi:hypothetical protein BM221_000228 [Beauveria bassiana]|uniref:Uncharacterized protein n=1 Tax=Beauveria bassiana TaxID=176275 RepID=A0A2N6NZU6_BEABA|nr:hypothetical protein BM221_000228 [Beauveria bassiana]